MASEIPRWPRPKYTGGEKAVMTAIGIGGTLLLSGTLAMVGRDSVTVVDTMQNLFGKNAAPILNTAASWGPYIFGAGVVDILATTGVVLNSARKAR